MKGSQITGLVILILGILVCGFLFVSEIGLRGSSATEKPTYPVQKSDRTMTGDPTSVRGQRRIRTLEQLLVALEEAEESDNSLLDSFILPSNDFANPFHRLTSTASFASDLNLAEVILLSKHLHDSSKGESGIVRALIFQRWGEDDPEDGFRLLDESGRKNADCVFGLYMGWAKRDARAALDHFRDHQPWVENDLQSHMAYFFIKTAIVGRLAQTEPEAALKLVEDYGGLSDLQEKPWKTVTLEERDAVFRELPEDTDWRKIADKVVETDYMINDHTVMADRGPGEVMLARWSESEPDEAYHWAARYDAEKAPDLLKSWYYSEPDTAIVWIDGQLDSGERKKALPILAELLRACPLDSQFLKWATQLPKLEDRIQVLYSATSSVRHTTEFIGGSIDIKHSVEPRYRDLAEIKRMLPEFNLPPNDQQKIEKRLLDWGGR